MCGIAGEIRLDGLPDEAAVRRMSESLRHRGPDADGFLRDGPAALAHRRLSILDLSGGAQPMAREGCAIVFNGEAYRHEELRRDLAARGHAFTTRSDTESVLRAYLEWGDAFLERLDGMFALAIWDGRRRRLLLARDRMGKKPLHYAVAQGGAWAATPPGVHLPGVTRLVFGSELKAFAAHGGVPRDISPEAVAGYLATEYVAAPRSIHRAIF